MQPSARIAAVIELAGLVENEKQPADHLAAAYFHSRRYIGAGDRRAISLRLWGVLRRRARLDWWLCAQGGRRNSRGRVLADLVFDAKLTLPEVAALFTGHDHGPAPLSAEEREAVQAWQGFPLVDERMPGWVAGEYPQWLEPGLAEAFGTRLAAEMAAMSEPAPVDLRVNTLKADLATARVRLAADGLATEITPYSPVGLRLPARTALTAQAAFREGLVEVQDEGSQLVGLLVDALPGQAVADYCAGAGGKTLVLAAAMRNTGRLVALDIDERRAQRAGERLRRAGVSNVTRKVIGAGEQKWLKRQAGLFHRVLVDAPCTGTGTWRRNPDAKWRLAPRDIEELTARQDAIAASAARLVRPGGRLVYATCSVLADENERRVEAFLAAHSDFFPQPVGAVWQAVLGTDCPAEGPFLRLTPGLHGTDGFFVAILQRSEKPPS